MKKIIFLVVFLVVGIIPVKAVNIKVVKPNGVVLNNYIPQSISGKKVFKLLNQEIELTSDEKRILNNLAYVGNLCETEVCEATVQMLIWQNLKPEYEYYLVNSEDEIISYSNSLKFIEEKLESYNKVSNFKDNYYEIGLNEKIEIDSNIKLNNYYSDKFSFEITRNHIRIAGFNKPGLYEIKFMNLYHINNDSIYATNEIYEEFSIYVNVLGNTGVINVEENVSLNFDLYDLEGNYLENIWIRPENNKFYFKKGMGIKLVDVTNGIYETVNEIIIEDNDEDIYEINISLKKKKANVKIDAILTFYLKPDDGKKDNLDITIKAQNFNELERCQGESCNLELEYGNYLVVDNMTNKTYYLNIYEKDYSYTITHYYINGFITTLKDFEIRKNGEKLELDYNNNVWYLAKDISFDEYDLVINDKTYKIDLRDANNYKYIENLGLFYLIDIHKDNNDKSDNSDSIDTKPNDNEGNKDNDTIIVEIPNTGISVEETIYENKKKFYIINTDIMY